jgi:hypothetical protein
MKRNTLGASSAIPGANTLTLTLTNTTVGDTGEYWIVATNALGSAESTCTVVSITSNLVISNTSGDNLNVEIGGTLNLTAELIAGSQPVTYQWMVKFAGGAAVPVPGATSLNLTILNAQESNTGQYWIEATNALGSATSSPTQVKLLEAGVPDV